MPPLPRHWSREYLVHAVLLIVVLIGVFPRVFASGHMITSAYVLYDFAPWSQYGAPGDFPHDQSILTWEFLGQFTGWYAVANRALAAGEWPFWNPFEYCGVPLLANYQSAVFYPPRILHAILNIHVASTILILLKVWLCGFTAYIYGRRIRLSVNASRFLSFAWMLGMYNMIWTYWCEVDVSAWFPLQMLAIEWLLQERYRRGFFLLAFSATLMLLAGHPESAFTFSLCAGIFFLLRLGGAWKGLRAPFKVPAYALASWIVALLVSAGQILPFLEYLKNSYTLAERADEAASEHALSALALVNFWVPRYYGLSKTPTENYWGAWINSNFNTILYPGLIVILGILAFIATFATQRKTAKWRCLAFAIPALIAMLVVFDHGSIQFMKRIPILGSMWSLWWYAFPAFALPVIGAHGIDHWFGERRSLRQWMLVAIPAALFTGLCFALYFAFQRNIHVMEGKGLERYVQGQLIVATNLAVAGVAVLWTGTRPMGQRAQIAIVSLLLIDLLIAARGLHPTAPLHRVYPQTKLTDWLAAQNPPARCALGSKSSATIPDGVMQYYGVEDFLGYDGIYPKRIRLLRNCVKLWNSIEPVFSVRYFLNVPALNLFVPDDKRAQFKLVDTIDGLQIYENTRAWPRVKLVGGARVISESARQFDVLSQTSFNPERTVLLEEPPARALPEIGEEETGSAHVESRTNNTVSVRVDAKTDALLVLADQYFPGWTAYVDGEQAKVLSAYYAFRAVEVPVGSHTVVFRYEPRSFYFGLAISIVTLLLSAFVAMLCMRRHRSRRIAA